MEPLTIAGRRVGPSEPPYVIAEIGSNHNGDVSLCRTLIDAASACGADAVKFQSWSKDSLVSRAEYARNTQYQKLDPSALTLEQSVEKYQLTPEMHREVAAHCAERGIIWFSSVFSRREVHLLESLGAPVYKIASMDVNHLPLLSEVGKTGKPVILSTGLATLGEIETALETLRKNGSGPVALLHCVSIYPSEPSLVHLKNIETLQRAFDVPVGYSDHSLGTAIPLAAIALGACIVEKHFTTDKGLPGWDHAVSADPAEMRTLVAEGRNVQAALGSAVRRVSELQLEKRKAFRRRMVAGRALRKGETVGPEDVEFKRPGTGIRPDELGYVVGRTLVRDVAAEDELEWADFV